VTVTRPHSDASSEAKTSIDVANGAPDSVMAALVHKNYFMYPLLVLTSPLHTNLASSLDMTRPHFACFICIVMVMRYLSIIWVQAPCSVRQVETLLVSMMKSKGLGCIGYNRSIYYYDLGIFYEYHHQHDIINRDGSLRYYPYWHWY
jgi:hypothetical protein